MPEAKSLVAGNAQPLSLPRDGQGFRRQGGAVRLPQLSSAPQSAPRAVARRHVPAQRQAGLPARHEHPGPQRLRLLGPDRGLLHALLLLKAGNFNAVRTCQHVEFPEVLEWMDRLGMMSEQDQGGGYRGSIDMGIRREQHIHTGTVLARQTYNNPGVVLLTFGNEHEFPTEPIVRAALAEDPQRVFKPISGRFTHSREPLGPAGRFAGQRDRRRPSVFRLVRQRRAADLEQPADLFLPRRMVTLGEFGAEALDAYETMHDHYPPQFKPPAPETDTLWAASQVQKHDVKQIVGLGRDPKNLAEYIEASQNYQEAAAGRQSHRHASLAAGDRRLFPVPLSRRGAGLLAEVDRQP